MKLNFKKITFALISVLFFYNVFAQENAASAEFDTTAAENMQSRARLANASKDYPVTAGDVYQLSFAAGANAVTYTIPVDSTYSIKVANLATIDGSGKTFIELKRQVERIVNLNYPMSGVQFFILNPSSFNIVVKGEVSETQIKQTWALNRLSSVLDNNLTQFASRRFITVVSKDGKQTEYDLFKANRDGDLTQNPYLRPEDTIIISRYDRRVTITGAVERPGSYEILEGENLKSLVERYGAGLTNRADKTRTELFRTYDAVGLSGKKIYLKENVFTDDYVLEDKDSVAVASYDDLLQVAFFEGAVYVSQDDTSLESSNKISVPFNEGENYAFFIRRNSSSFSNSSDLKNAYIRRVNEIIPINLETILYDNKYYSDITVMPYDTVVIPFMQSFVTVAGAVKTPGRYPYIPDRTYEYYVGLAGGFDKDQNANDAIRIYDVNMKRYSKSKYITPESTINAPTTSFTYFFNKYAPVVTTVLSLATTTLTAITAINSMN